ncbi:MAG: SUMF1/EgtB/PvdO family nonheme iron enzyme [Planctomycetes bacterium]|nr:SUMF1/EgtB/PvdO family nonheme iron enzyme [Planctomycetota bacterium]
MRRSKAGRALAALMALSLGGCTTHATFRGLGYDECWDVVLSTVRERAEVIQADKGTGTISARALEIAPEEEAIDLVAGPYRSPFAPLISNAIDVQVRPEGEAEVSVSIEAATVYRTFYTEFERDRNEELQRLVLAEIERNLLERIERRRLAESLAAMRESAPAREGMLYVPAMTFTMGEDGAYEDAGPAHAVALSPFLIDQDEVTIEEYDRFIEQGGYENESFWTREGWEWRAGYSVVAPAGWKGVTGSNRSLPVTGVSWYEADAFARWAGKRLPTEAEWELAARAHLRTIWPWGNLFRPYANYLELELHGPEPVGSHPEGDSPVGLADMAGNAAEWCADWYDPGWYSRSPEHDPLGSEAGSEKILRGGSFEEWKPEIQTFYRDRARPGYQHPTFGFRCAAGVPSPEAAPAPATAPAEAPRE